MSLYVVFTGSANFRMNFWEVDGKGLSATTRPAGADHLPDRHAGGRAGHEHADRRRDRRRERHHRGRVLHRRRERRRRTTPRRTASTGPRRRRTTTSSTPSRPTTPGCTRTSRKVRFTVGEFGVQPPWTTFGNTHAGGDVRPARRRTSPSAPPAPTCGRRTNQYGVVYLPGGTPENFEAVVKVASFDGTHPNSKAGIMVRNDITQRDQLARLHGVRREGQRRDGVHARRRRQRPGQQHGEPVATGCGTGSEPTG